MAVLIDWLLSPLDPARVHQVDWAVSWHGRLMVLAWLFAFPSGIVIARFFKITPRQNWPAVLDNIFWWKQHLRLQYLGGVFVTVAMLIALTQFTSGVGSTVTAHHILGWCVVTATTVQFIAGWMRGTKGGPTKPAPDGSLRGDHYDMTLRRVVFEYVHKMLGYIVLLAAWVTVALGLRIANAPRWMALGAALAILTHVALFTLFQTRGMARDTYQAIWGPGKEHPGSAKRPIGWGVRRQEPE